MDAKLLLLAWAALLVGAGCTLTQPKDPSVIYTSSNDSKILQGVAYDQGQLPEGSWEKLVVPEGTKVVRADGGFSWRCVMRKEMDFAGQPQESISLDILRREMGCAVRREGNRILRIGTFGDNKSKGQGKLKTTLTVYVPQTLKVEFVENQTGVDTKGKLSSSVAMNAVPQEWAALIDSPDPAEAAFHRSGEAESTAEK